MNNETVSKIADELIQHFMIECDARVCAGDRDFIINTINKNKPLWSRDIK